MPTEIQRAARNAAINAAGALRVEYLCGGYSETAARVVLLLDRVGVEYLRGTGIRLHLPDTADARMHGSEVLAAIAARVRKALTRTGRLSDRQTDSVETAHEPGGPLVLTWHE